MNDKTIKPDQTGDILTYEVSDEVLEAAARRNGKAENFALSF
jgi:hypothetical protein